MVQIDLWNTIYKREIKSFNRYVQMSNQ